MSHTQDVIEDDLAPTQTEGYKVGQSKTVAELANLDKEDESLQRWKQSLGLASSGSGGAKAVVLRSLFLSSPTLTKPIIIDLTQSPADLAKLKKDPGEVTLYFRKTKTSDYQRECGVFGRHHVHVFIENEIVSGLKYIQVVKRSGIKVDKMEAMLGSYGPRPEAYEKIFASEESPSGMLARSGSYVVRSRVVDDDQHVWLDFEWGFKLGKEW